MDMNNVRLLLQMAQLHLSRGGSEERVIAQRCLIDAKRVARKQGRRDVERLCLRAIRNIDCAHQLEMRA